MIVQYLVFECFHKLGAQFYDVNTTIDFDPAKILNNSDKKIIRMKWAWKVNKTSIESASRFKQVGIIYEIDTFSSLVISQKSAIFNL